MGAIMINWGCKLAVFMGGDYSRLFDRQAFKSLKSAILMIFSCCLWIFSRVMEKRCVEWRALYFFNEGENMQETLLQQGIELMIYGMGTVFTFLAVLVLVTLLQSMIVSRFFPEAIIAAKPITQAPVASNNNEQLIAVISAAVHQYRSRQK
jgi:oxaloacetate decarboxylase gamma subunit